MSVHQKSRTPDPDRDLWQTPPTLYADIALEYGPFILDAAANSANAKCDRWLGPGSPIAEDATDPYIHWGQRMDRVFVNPPYSNPAVFVNKAWREAKLGNARTTLLLPATPDVRWFHEYIWDREHRRFRPGVECQFLKGRVRYIRPDGTEAGTPLFGSVIVTFYGAA